MLKKDNIKLSSTLLSPKSTIHIRSLTSHPLQSGPCDRRPFPLPSPKRTRTEPSRSAGQQLTVTAAAERNGTQGLSLSSLTSPPTETGNGYRSLPRRQPAPLLPPRQNDNRRAGEESIQPSRPSPRTPFPARRRLEEPAFPFPSPSIDRPVGLTGQFAGLAG